MTNELWIGFLVRRFSVSTSVVPFLPACLLSLTWTQWGQILSEFAFVFPNSWWFHDNFFKFLCFIHCLGRQTSSFCSQTNFVTNRIIEAKGLRVAFQNRSSFAKSKWIAISERLWPHYLGLGSWFFPRELSIHHMPSISLMLTAIGTRQCNLRLIILRFPIDRLCARARAILCASP